MPIMILLVVIIGLIFTSILSFAEDNKKLGIFCLLALFILGGWIAVSYSAQNEMEYTYETQLVNLDWQNGTKEQFVNGKNSNISITAKYQKIYDPEKFIFTVSKCKNLSYGINWLSLGETVEIKGK